MPPKKSVKKSTPRKESAAKPKAKKPARPRQHDPVGLAAGGPVRPARLAEAPAKRVGGPVRPKAAPKPVTRAEAKQPVADAAVERESVSERYWEAVGRRKTAVARVRLFTKGGKGVWVNEKLLANYFPYPHLRQLATEALETMNSQDHFRTSVKVSGGGLHAQAEAIRHGTARALILFNPDFRKRLKKAGFLTRDPRMKERKKFGLKGARRAPQWAKR